MKKFFSAQRDSTAVLGLCEINVIGSCIWSTKINCCLTLLWDPWLLTFQISFNTIITCHHTNKEWYQPCKGLLINIWIPHAHKQRHIMIMNNRLIDNTDRFLVCTTKKSYLFCATISPPKKTRSQKWLNICGNKALRT